MGCLHAALGPLAALRDDARVDSNYALRVRGLLGGIEIELDLGCVGIAEE